VVARKKKSALAEERMKSSISKVKASENSGTRSESSASVKPFWKAGGRINVKNHIKKRKSA